MKCVGKSSVKLSNVYLVSSATTCGPKELLGPLGKYMDKGYHNIYCNQESWEKAEIELQKEALEILIKKSGIKIEQINCIIGGDLNNQLGASHYMLRKYNIPFLGVYSACATFCESIIIASSLIEAGFFEYVATISSSHNSTSERQFRYPTEYGGQKPVSSTSTVTGCGASLISKYCGRVKITGFTIGHIVDPSLYDSQDMGRTMAPAAANTLKQHLEDFNVSCDDYDLILTGDLSEYGKEIFLNILNEYNIRINKNYNDAGLMIYDRVRQNVFAGGSGSGCVSIVTLGYVIEEIKKGVYNRVLIIATGALINPIMIAQNESIPAIAHAIVLERS